jgi:hypothetical protein
MKLTDIKNQMKMFEYLKLKAMHHKVIVIQVRVYNVFFLVLHYRLGVYINQTKAENVTLYTISSVLIKLS